MTSNKCKHCGIVNAVSDCACRRCGRILGPMRNRREAAARPSFLYLLLAVTLIGGSAYYLYSGFEKSYDQIMASEANRVAAQPNVSPAPLTSRAEYDQKRTEPYKNAVANSQGIAASKKHNEEVKRLMQNKSQ